MYPLKLIHCCRWLGFDHIYLTENRSERPIRLGIMDFINSGFVTYTTQKTPHAQIKTYHKCLLEHRTKYDWMAFFDADEFLLLREGCVQCSDIVFRVKLVVLGML